MAGIFEGAFAVQAALSVGDRVDGTAADAEQRRDLAVR
jgi:hypothetical protein